MPRVRRAVMLPPELVNAVLEGLRQPLDVSDMREMTSAEALQTRRDLRSLMLVSHVFASIARPHLYRSVYLTFGNVKRGGELRTLVSLAKYLRAHPEVAVRIRNIALCKHEVAWTVPQRCHLEELSAVLQLLPMLRNLGLCNVKITERLPESPISRPITLDRCQMWAERNCESYEARDIAGVLTILGPIKTLSIKYLTLEYFDGWDALRPLNSLVITDGLHLDPLGQVGTWLNVLLSTPTTIPSTLTTLALRYIGRDDLEPLWRLVKTVAPSIQVVRLGFLDGSGLDRVMVRKIADVLGSAPRLRELSLGMVVWMVRFEDSEQTWATLLDFLRRAVNPGSNALEQLTLRISLASSAHMPPQVRPALVSAIQDLLLLVEDSNLVFKSYSDWTRLPFTEGQKTSLERIFATLHERGKLIIYQDDTVSHAD